jgi:hypothetical protein
MLCLAASKSSVTFILLKLQPAKELIKEIAVLELEVVYLERYLLSLYRKTFEQQVSSLSTKDERDHERFKMSSNTHKGMFPSVPGKENDIMSDKDHSADNASHLTSLTKERNDTRGPEKLLDSSIHRCHSSMSQRSIGTSPTTRSVARAVDSCHSLPLSMLEVTWLNWTVPNNYSSKVPKQLNFGKE